MVINVCVNHNAILIDGEWYYVPYERDIITELQKENFALANDPNCEVCQKQEEHTNEIFQPERR